MPDESGDRRILRIAPEAKNGFERAGRRELSGDDIRAEIDRDDTRRTARLRLRRRSGGKKASQNAE